MIILLPFILLLCLRKPRTPHYAFAGIANNTIKKEKKLDSVFFFRSNESYAGKEDAKRMLDGNFSFGGNKLYENAVNQQNLNNSKRARKIRKTQKNQEKKRNAKRIISSLRPRDYITLFIYLVLPFLLIGVLEYTEIFSLLKKVIISIDEHRTDMYLSQLSLTFITISLMSIFSDSNAIILWENIVKKTLIEPPASCFKAYFSYSFFYLFLSTVSLVFKFDTGFCIFFLFNILCLFDLSRTMINCYYDPNRKKKKVIKDFIKTIEEANLAILKKGTDEQQNEYISKVKSTLEDFNYYIDEAFNKEKYNDMKENLGVYGKLLAHIDSATIPAHEMPILKWYCEKTYKAYIELIKNYFDECNAILTGITNTNSQPTNMSYNSIKRTFIINTLANLTNDAEDYLVQKDITRLILFGLYINIIATARNIDHENLDKYFITAENFKTVGSVPVYNEANLAKSLRKLCKALYTKEHHSVMINYSIEQALGETLGQIILIKNDYTSLLDLNFLCWDEIENRKEIIDCMNNFVEEHIKECTEERKKQCLTRKETVLRKMACADSMKKTKNSSNDALQ